MHFMISFWELQHIPKAVPSSAPLTGVSHAILGASLVAQTVKNLPAMWETQVQSLGREDALEEGIAAHSSILAWRVP